ncbi:signal peptidase I [Candidatus Pacearchaeota archaeon]|nr:signal peptidase I [Candidatus Pacearchaeota archaeon]
MPLVVVESGSMHHPGSFLGNLLVLESNFDKWWVQSEIWYTNIGITKEQAINWPLKTGIEIGDIILVVRASNLKVGDIIIFNAGQSHPIIHRIIEIKEQDGKKVYSTKGDNNSGQLQIEKEIQESAIIGKAYLRLPKLGWIKLVFVKIIQYFS